ncbi:type III restriction system endonuclease, putative [Microbacterium esteraromaticum]|uniref:site-specific DNA-methyltransferase (adenine-specific) n=1 Tax=Microbacterium esteraromaticum TaxID=57043 RepID=A0A1R4KQP4_9MICO|nr:Eco57I restriction-modification methylase domain-containing protein [Microbacterium esteraromaticum]SJN46610.1 type III restriction system endonuclease, putative [Microbacterium esteraromaticum]
MSAPVVESKAAFTLRAHNPDVLTCIANLSNDEVFTPPELAKQMLHTLEEAWAKSNDGASIWADPEVTFFDPFTKSGVFLREIVARLTSGLEAAIPDLNDRVDHILTRQVFGIGITQLTALLARRSVYCSKDATGKHSIAKSFDRDWGNIWFERTEHSWSGGKTNHALLDGEGAPTVTGRRCRFCGAAESEYLRDSALESHAYAFIHTDDIKARINELFGADMQFDVIIGNPPYQLNDGGGTGSSARPIYQLFIQQAQRLEPRFLSMVVKANWYTGGKGLDHFRNAMLSDRRIRALTDFPDSRQAFDGVDIAGGVCYFLWERDNPGDCVVETRVGSETIAVTRRLDEHAVFVRDNRALVILEKVRAISPSSLSRRVSARNPFTVNPAHERDQVGDLYLYASGADGRVERKYVARGEALIDAWKVLVSKTSSEHAGQTDKQGQRRVLSRLEVMPPASVATGSYLVIGPFSSESEASNAVGYLRTRFARFLISAILLTQNMTRGSYEFVPDVGFERAWTDEDLYTKYDLTPEEVTLIETQIKPMTFSAYGDVDAAS